MITVELKEPVATEQEARAWLKEQSEIPAIKYGYGFYGGDVRKVEVDGRFAGWTASYLRGNTAD